MVAPLAVSVVVLGVSTGTAGAAVRSRTDSFTFRNSAGTSVTCTVQNVQDLSASGVLHLSTTISGPADCEADFIEQYQSYNRRSDGEPQTPYVEGRGRSLSSTYDDVAAPVRSGYLMSFPACDCGFDYQLSQPK